MEPIIVHVAAAVQDSALLGPLVRKWSLPIAKVDPSEASMTLTAVGSRSHLPAGKKENKHKTQEDHTCNKVTGLHKKSGSLYSENVRGVQKVGQTIVWGWVLRRVETCGKSDLSQGDEDDMADVSGIRGKWSTVK